MTFDEAKRGLDVEEDVLKQFTGGASMTLRRNHEADTMYHKFSYVGKAWCVNSGEIPPIPTATDRTADDMYLLPLAFHAQQRGS